jgi:hypothetical protein
MDELLRRAAEVAAAFRASLPERRVHPGVGVDELLAAFGDGPVPDAGRAPADVVEELVAAAELTRSARGRSAASSVTVR